MDINKSDPIVIKELKRLGIIQNNKIIVDKYPQKFNQIITKCLAKIQLVISGKITELVSIEIIKTDKNIPVNAKMNSKIYCNKFATGKKRTVGEIMNILYNNEQTK